MAKRQISLSEAELKDMIREAVGKKLNELLLDKEPEMKGNREYQRGDVISTEEFMEFLAQGGKAYTRINSRDCDVERGFGNPEQLKDLLNGTGSYSNTLYINSINKKCTPEDVLGWKVTDANRFQLTLSPEFRDPEIQRIWDEDTEGGFRDKSDWVNRYGAH